LTAVVSIEVDADFAHCCRVTKNNKLRAGDCGLSGTDTMRGAERRVAS